MNYLSNTDIIEIHEGLRAVGFDEVRILEILISIRDGALNVGDVADIIECAEDGDDDELFMLMATLGVA